jgi:uncharacterized protein (DUF433 family)
MMIWQLTDDDVEAVVNLMKKGHSVEEIAKEFGMSVEMVVCATRKWPRMQRKFAWRNF